VPGTPSPRLTPARHVVALAKMEVREGGSTLALFTNHRSLVTYAGLNVTSYDEFLNEARLTALALSLFLAAVKLADPDPTSPEPLRVLLLDDVLIGLDLSHRLPLLDLLHSEFPNHQIFLFTHDIVWFDIARGHTEHWGKWRTFSIFSDTAGVGLPEVP
jgi:recombinational DNA repair ATPase RecF